MEAVEHAHVGVEGLFIRGIGDDEGGEAPQTIILTQKLDHWRCEFQQPGIGGGVEAVAKQPEIEKHQGDSNEAPERDSPGEPPES